MRRLLVLAILAAAIAAPAAVAWSPPIQCIAYGIGGQKVHLIWSNATTAYVRVYRDNRLVAIRPSTFKSISTDLPAQPLGVHIYRVCELAGNTGTGRCSNPDPATIS